MACSGQDEDRQGQAASSGHHPTPESRTPPVSQDEALAPWQPEQSAHQELPSGAHRSRAGATSAAQHPSHASAVRSAAVRHRCWGWVPQHAAVAPQGAAPGAVPVAPSAGHCRRWGGSQPAIPSTLAKYSSCGHALRGLEAAPLRRLGRQQPPPPGPGGARGPRTSSWRGTKTRRTRRSPAACPPACRPLPSRTLPEEHARGQTTPRRPSPLRRNGASPHATRPKALAETRSW